MPWVISRFHGIHLTTLRTLLLVICMALPNAPGLLAQETPASGTETSAASMALQGLTRSFFEWRRSQQPAQGDDIPRVERPDGWVPDFSPDALQEYREQYSLFLESLDEIDTENLSVVIAGNAYEKPNLAGGGLRIAPGVPPS